MGTQRMRVVPSFTASVIGILVLSPIGGCRTLETTPEKGQTTLSNQAPSTQVFDTSRKHFFPPEALKAKLADAGFVLLGETHDNAEHHRQQARVLSELARTRKVGAVVFEQFHEQQQATLDAFLARPDASSTQLGKAVAWETSGWPPWELYEPIARVAIEHKLPIRAGGISGERLRQVRKDGPAALLAQEDIARLDLDKPWPSELREKLAQTLRESHCGHPIPASMLDSMIRVQRTWDARMATELARIPQGTVGVLIAGAGHVRKDWAVPKLLGRLRPEDKIVSLAFVESAGSLETEHSGIAALYDYLWPTPPAQRPDPCAAMKRPK